LAHFSATMSTSTGLKDKYRIPQNDMVASLDLSSGGAQWRQMPWHAGYVTPCSTSTKHTRSWQVHGP